MITTASCGLLYGAINTTKTTNLGRIALWLYERYGLTSRLITADNEFDTLKPLIEAGVIEHWAIKSLGNPFGVLTKLSQGYWPVVVNNKLIMRASTPAELAKVGAYLIEGTTTIGELCHEDHIRKGRAIGEDVVGKFTELVDTDAGAETLTFAKSARAHYQQVQDFITMNLIPTFSMLPVQWVWWSGHEYAGEDEATGQTRLGPGVVGKAATMKVPRVVGNTFHMVASESTVTDPRTHKTTRTMERRAYFEPHADSFNKIMMWPAGVKIPTGHVKAWQERFPDGYIPLILEQQGVEAYLQFQYEMAKTEQRLVITPGTEVFRPVTAGAGVQSASTPVSNSGEMRQATPAPATQTRPPLRAPLLRQGQILRRPTPVPDTLAQTLQKSIDKVNGEKAVAAAHEALVGQPVELPDINAITTEKGE